MFISSKKLSQVKQASFIYFKSLIKYEYFYSLGIFSTFAVLHLHIVINHPIESENISFYLLYWLGILFLIWQDRQQYNQTNWFCSLLGFGLLFTIIFRPLHLWNLDLLLFRSAPIIAAFGLGLMFFGLGLRHHWRLFLLLCLMVFPYGFVNEFFTYGLHLSELTATISAFSLHYLGFNAIAQDSLVKLPTGQVQVLYFCTGGVLIIWLLKLTLLIMVIVTALTWRQKLGLISCAVCTGFLIGCIRVALLAVVVNNHSLFEYWHGSTGGSLFMALATIIYALFCNWILPLELLYSTEKNNSVIPVIVNHKRILFLLVTWVGIILTSVYLIVNKRLLNTLTLPDLIALNSWQQVKVKSWNNQKANSLADTKMAILQSGKDYTYLRNGQHLELQMRYFINTKGESNPFLDQISANLAKDSQKNIRYIKEIGYYLLYSDTKQAYLTACINPRGGGTITSAQFMQNRYTYDLTWNRLLPWFLGKEILRDNRCIWTQLSIPLNGVVDSKVYPVLESFWSENYMAWQSLFINIY
ncbi:MAG: cyanoexosortase A system-associated protein [Nostoc sp.]|uniref:cyanoexosortase A system-associated protein n=1 Tax=Nostoc sp. TaxID=1180 RepID=UPI002FEE7A60